jgi:hypothetical protein
MSLLLRTRVDAASFLPAVTRLVHAIDPSQPVAASTTIRRLVSEELARPRLNALLATAFGLTALALAALIKTPSPRIGAFIRVPLPSLPGSTVTATRWPAARSWPRECRCRGW